MSDKVISQNKPGSKSAHFTELVRVRYSRRTFVQQMLASAVSTAVLNTKVCGEVEPARSEQASQSRYRFIEVTHGLDETHHVAPDHLAQVLIRWGDPLFADSPPFDPYTQSAERQERQFGYNNDYIGFLQLPSPDDEKQRALLCINHEYPSSLLMFSGLAKGYPVSKTADQCEVEKAAVGCSILEIEGKGVNWVVVKNSRYARRITARTTRMLLTGPVAGRDRVKTGVDATGRNVIGTLNNCAGGMTPWGTFLTCEENFNYHFSGQLANDHPEAKNHERYGVPKDLFQWGRFDPRFNLQEEPNEPNRFGWVVEIDPRNPDSVPKKRTALGRFKHEGAEAVVAPDGRVVIYMGDDQRFDYLYKFVTAAPYRAAYPQANQDLLDEGTLYVAQFHADGWLDWLPLTFGSGPLTADQGFQSQADVLIETRRAADLLGATPLDRPEDVQPVAASGKVYVMLTNNTERKPEATDAVNPRGPNHFGHIVELSETAGDFTATRTRWEILIRGGDPKNKTHQAHWHPATTKDGWFASPDNGAVDPQHRLWVSTDQGDKWRQSKTADGLWGLETDGILRGTGKMFFRCPIGAELCGPQFSDDGESLFLSVQHPGADSMDKTQSSFDKPSTRWPDFEKHMPPRPAVMVVRRKNGGKVG